MSTAIAKEQDINRDWYVVDLEDVVLGRAATEIARILRGKHKPIYSPSVDVGDFVIVHAGFALRRIDREEGLETLKLFQEGLGLELIK